MTTPADRFVEAMRKNPPRHYYCEDVYYACPQHPEVAEEGECRCAYQDHLEFRRTLAVAFFDTTYTPEPTLAEWLKRCGLEDSDGE